MHKSFTETPVHCQNILIAGVVTPEMQARLDQIAVKVYILDDLLNDDGWDNFRSATGYAETDNSRCGVSFSAAGSTVIGTERSGWFSLQSVTRMMASFGYRASIA